MSVTHRTLGVAQESSFGSLSATTNLPDNSGYTYISIPCEMDPILVYGEPVASERNDAKDICRAPAGALQISLKW